jgi:uncharacterized protein (DUF2267 family)
VKYDELLRYLESVVQLNSCPEAEPAGDATLETIREPITGEQANNLAGRY